MFYSCFIIVIIYFNLIGGVSMNPNDDKTSKTDKLYAGLFLKLANQLEVLNKNLESSSVTWRDLNKDLNSKLVTNMKTIRSNIKTLLEDYTPVPRLNSNCNRKYPASCAEALTARSPDGVYQLHSSKPEFDPISVYCMKDPNYNGSAWTIIQRRIDGTTDFYRNLKDYKNGFGNLNHEYFLGLEPLHILTHSQLHELWILMEDFYDEKRFARYNSFIINDATFNYAIQSLGSFDGDAGDSLIYHQDRPFSTWDSYPEYCAAKYRGAWWYHNQDSCYHSNLNGEYITNLHDMNNYGRGINWITWHGHYHSLKYVHMAIRPVKR